MPQRKKTRIKFDETDAYNLCPNLQMSPVEHVLLVRREWRLEVPFSVGESSNITRVMTTAR